MWIDNDTLQAAVRRANLEGLQGNVVDGVTVVPPASASSKESFVTVPRKPTIDDQL